MANKRISDLPEATTATVGDVVAIDGTTTRKITIENMLDDNLVAIKGLTSAADKGIQFTGLGTAATYDLTAAGKALLDDADAAAQRTTLGLVIGTNVQAYDADLAALAANSTDGLWAHTGSGTGAARTLTAPAAGLTITNPAGVAGNPTFALANDLAALEGLATTGIARRTGADTWSVGTAVSNSELATMAAYTIKGNATGSSATPTDISIPALTQKASPVSGDMIMIVDSAASNALKYATVGSVASAGSVASINGSTGAVTFSVVKQIFTASGTYTPTAGMDFCIIECVGGGGGGGAAVGATSSLYSGGGGGSGGYSRLVATAATIGASKTVTIGAAGSGGAAGSNNGTAGGDTSVGALCIAKGGSGGLYGATAGQVPGAGAGGVSGTGDLTAAGNPGTPGMYSTSTAVALNPSTGGCSIFGGGAAAVTPSSGVNATGNSAGAYGSGGSGGVAFNVAGNAAGGNGSAGVVFITEFIVN